MNAFEKPAWIVDNKDEVERILALYPQKRSALLPLAHLAQNSRGYLNREDFVAIGELIHETPAYVESTTSFYTMFRRHPHGRYTLTVCTNLSCAMGGGFELIDHLKKRLGIESGQTTDDGLVTLEETHECLASCDGAPCCQVNLIHFLKVSPEQADELLAKMEKDQLDGVEPDAVSHAAFLEHKKYDEGSHKDKSGASEDVA